ncbi:MAG: hypothetical protein BM485_01835 [Desulfobulbaceae bacterium DB1]|nr:MAG: hypothetical protein BM485_01835 [Desulfobulbaceae bacterium DB1]
MRCATCHNKIETDKKIYFRDECPHCGADLHICKNCFFYDLNAENDCRESSAELVIDKDLANFCEYFRPADDDQAGGAGGADDVKKQLEALFKRKM